MDTLLPPETTQTPREIVESLDHYIVGQQDAKKAVALLGAVPQPQRSRSTLRQAWLAALVGAYPCG